MDAPSNETADAERGNTNSHEALDRKERGDRKEPKATRRE